MGCVSSTPSEIRPNTDSSNSNTKLLSNKSLFAPRKINLLSTSSTSVSSVNNNNNNNNNTKSNGSYNINEIVEIFDLKTSSWFLCKITDIKGSYIEVCEYNKNKEYNDKNKNDVSLFESKLHSSWDKYRIRTKKNKESDSEKKESVLSSSSSSSSPSSSYQLYLECLSWKQRAPYPLCLKKSICKKLRIGDHIDHRDSVGHFVLAKVIEKKINGIKIHYVGWNNKWDRWCFYNKITSQSNRFFYAGSISERQGHRLKYLRIGDYIDFYYNNKWYYAQIKSSDKMSAQIRLIFYIENKQRTYWSHIDNENEVQPFGKKCGMNKIKNDEQIINHYKINQNIQIKDIYSTTTTNTTNNWILCKIINKKFNWIKIKYLDKNNQWRSNEILHIIHNKDRIRNNINIDNLDNNNHNKLNTKHYQIFFKDYIVPKMDENNNKQQTNPLIINQQKTEQETENNDDDDVDEKKRDDVDVNNNDINSDDNHDNDVEHESNDDNKSYYINKIYINRIETKN